MSGQRTTASVPQVTTDRQYRNSQETSPTTPTTPASPSAEPRGLAGFLRRASLRGQQQPQNAQSQPNDQPPSPTRRGNVAASTSMQEHINGPPSSPPFSHPEFILRIPN